MIIRDEQRNWQGIQCDKCDTVAPPAVEIIRSFGLVRLGWYCSGGTHICPRCPHPKDS